MKGHKKICEKVVLVLNRLSRFQKLFVQLMLALFAVIWLYPLTQMVTQSLRGKGIENYISVLTKSRVSIPKSIYNSFIISITTCILALVIVSLGAYAFSKMKFKFKDTLYYMLLACLAIPPAAISVPLFFTVKGFGLNSQLAVIFPLLAFQSPFALLILRNYFDTIPGALIEAAHIDGAKSFTIFTHIMIPLTKPALVNILILTFINSWNEYLIPLLVVRKLDDYTVTLATSQFTGSIHQTPEMVGQLYASLVMMSIPTILIYIFAQKYLQAGLTAGAVKS